MNIEIKLKKDLNYNLQLHRFSANFQNEMYTLIHFKRYIGEGGRLISDMLVVSDKSNIADYLVTTNIGKASDSLDHRFLLLVFLKNWPW